MNPHFLNNTSMISLLKNKLVASAFALFVAVTAFSSQVSAQTTGNSAPSTPSVLWTVGTLKFGHASVVSPTFTAGALSSFRIYTSNTGLLTNSGSTQRGIYNTKQVVIDLIALSTKSVTASGVTATYPQLANLILAASLQENPLPSPAAVTTGTWTQNSLNFYRMSFQHPTWDTNGNLTAFPVDCSNGANCSNGAAKVTFNLTPVKFDLIASGTKTVTYSDLTVTYAQLANLVITACLQENPIAP